MKRKRMTEGNEDLVADVVGKPRGKYRELKMCLNSKFDSYSGLDYSFLLCLGLQLSTFQYKYQRGEEEREEEGVGLVDVNTKLSLRCMLRIIKDKTTELCTTGSD